MRRIIKIGDEARRELAAGAEFLAQAVGRTIGPFGQNFALDKKNTITNDGVKIAGEIQLEDEVQNRGVTLLREAATKTVDEVGDGTTTAIVLAHAIYDAAARFLGDETVRAKMTPAEIIKKIEEERMLVTDKLREMAVPVETQEQLIASARVAVEDEALGEMIGRAQFEMGKAGFLIAEPTAERFSSVERIHGIRIDNGFGTSQVINNQEKQILEVEDTAILLTSYSIKDLKDWGYIMEICEKLAKDGQNKITIIARAWTDETVSYCLQNINKGNIKIYPLSAPYEDMQERFKDLAAVLGAKFYDSENSRLKDVVLSDLGFASRVTAKRYEAIITGKNDTWTNTRIEERAKQVREKLSGSVSEFEKKKLEERISQLENGFAILHVGSPSDIERQRLFDKCEDAVNAVRAAFQEGTVPGAGLALKTIAEQLPDDSILKFPLMEPYKLIMASAPKGFVVEDWVRDPLKVVRVALEKACAIAGTLASATGVVTEKKPRELDELFRTNAPKQ